VLQAPDTGQTADLRFLNFRSEDGTLFELSMAQPTRVKVTISSWLEAGPIVCTGSIHWQEPSANPGSMVSLDLLTSCLT
jgi:hypothetical protein